MPENKNNVLEKPAGFTDDGMSNPKRNPAAPKIKICGLTRVEEADYINEAGADLAGFVMYYPKSKRSVYPHTVLPIKERLAVLNPMIQTVAVTVSPTIEQLEAIERMKFDFIQIHGELRDEVLKQAHIPILRAYNIEDTVETENLLNEPKVYGVVFDGKIPGNGETFDWSVLRSFERKGKKLMLAGGLTEENVSRAILEVMPDIVDVSSGVEYEGTFRGKDPDKIKRFVAAAGAVFLK